MSFGDLALSMTRRSMRLVGDQSVLWYPVRAAEVPAYLSAGNAGVEVTGAVEFLPIETESGDVAVDSERVTFDTDDTTISDNGIARNTSVEFKSVRYDVYRVLPDGLGMTRCWLRRYDG